MHDIHRKFPVILGLRIMDAIRLIKERGFIPRIKSTDTIKNDLGNSFVPMRVNLCISNSIVTSYEFY